jgi:hypothetical protein
MVKFWENDNELSDSIISGNFLIRPNDYQLSKDDPAA